jgi:hypothetical protein
MPAKKGTGMLVIWAEVPDDMEDDFNRWYNEEHLIERLSAPGFLSAARYEAVSSGPKHLAIYELESPAVLDTPEYRYQLDHPTEWSKRISPAMRSRVFIRNVYRMIHPATLSDEIAESGMAPALQIGRMDIPPKLDEEWNNWYNTVYVPNYETVPGVIRGRRFGAVSGEPAYLTVYEFEHENASRSDEWAVQQSIDPRNADMRAAMIHAAGSPGIWKKTFELPG